MMIIGFSWSDPNLLHELMAGSPTTDTVVIDEVQRIPELLNVVHTALEEPCCTRFILTGSSARKLRRGGTNLLGGRAKSFSLHPFMACELGDFDIESALRVAQHLRAWVDYTKGRHELAYWRTIHS